MSKTDEDSIGTLENKHMYVDVDVDERKPNTSITDARGVEFGSTALGSAQEMTVGESVDKKMNLTGMNNFLT